MLIHAAVTTAIMPTIDTAAHCPQYASQTCRSDKEQAQVLLPICMINLCDRTLCACDFVALMRAVCVTCGRGDPNADGQDMFCPSNHDYPPFMRVNPVLSWSYTDVWAFLRQTGVTYCSLYDQGFTSVGSVDNTFPNRRAHSAFPSRPCQDT